MKRLEKQKLNHKNSMSDSEIEKKDLIVDTEVEKAYKIQLKAKKLKMKLKLI